MSTMAITEGKASSQQALLPLVLTERAMPKIFIAGTERVLAWDAHRPMAAAAQA